VPVRVLRDEQKSFDVNLPNNIANAIQWHVDVRGAGVINLSPITPPTPQLQSAIQHALDKGMVVVAAAGNDGTSNGPPHQPGTPPRTTA
jgi:membrane-anchored mycosin MYCP